MTLRLIAALAVLMGVEGTAHAQQAVESPQSVNYTDHVLPIFRQHCLKCHNADEAEAGLAIDSYSALMEGGGSGEIVAAGDPSGSRLFRVMTHDEEPTMPPNQEPLPAEMLEVIKAWIEGGLLESSGSKAKKRKGPSLTFSAVEAGAPVESIMPQSLWRVPVVAPSRAAAATALAASPSSPLVAVAGQRQVALYHSDNGELLGILPYLEGIPQVLQFSRDGAYLLAAGGTHASRGSASLYDVRNGQRLVTVGDELDTVFGADLNDQSSRIALGGPQKVVRIFDTSTGQIEFELKKHTDWIYAVVYSPDGVLVASGDRSGGLHVWEADTGRLYLDLVGHQGAVRGLAWRADSNVLVSGGEDGTIKLWELNSGNQLKSVNAHAGGVTGVAMARDGRIVTSGRDKAVKLWNADGSLAATMPSFEEPALEVAMTHDAAKILAGDWSGRTVLWSVSDPKQATELAANPPRLEDHQASLAKSIAELESQHKDAEATAATRRSDLEAAKKQAADLISQLEIVQQRLTKSNDQRQAAEKSLQEMQPLMAQQDQILEKSKARMKMLTSDSRGAAERLALTREQLEHSTQRLDRLAKEKLALEQSLASVVGEHDRHKSESLSVMAANSEAELNLLAQLQADRRLMSRFQENIAQQQSQLEELNQQVGSAMEISKQLTQQIELANVELKSAGEKELAAKTELNQVQVTVDSKSKEVEALRVQVGQAEDEATKNSLTEKLTIAEAELQSLLQNTSLAQKRLADATEKTTILSNQLQELAKNLESAKKDADQVTAERDQVANAIASLTEQQKQAAQKEEALSRRLDDLRAKIASAQSDRQETIAKLGELLERADGMKSQLQQAVRAIQQLEAEKASQIAKVSELDAVHRDLLATMKVVQGEIEVVEASRAELGKRVEEQMALIQSVQERIAQDSAAIPPLEEQLGECQSRVQQGEQTLAAATADVERLTQHLEQQRSRLTSIESELVAFRSEADSLRQKQALAQVAAQESMAALEPESSEARKLEELIASRESELAEKMETLNRLQQQVDELRKSRAVAQSDFATKQARIRELEAAAAEAESELDAARERVEFFESAYGRN